ncbi:hypothetical protein HS125_01085 [bacterium]|nr:hypothetical protein [bacterium]
MRVLRERRLSDEAQTPAGYVEIGRALAVDYVIVGSLAQRPDNRYRIHLSLLGVEEGRAVHGATGSGRGQLRGPVGRAAALAGGDSPGGDAGAVAAPVCGRGAAAAATAAPAWATLVALLSPRRPNGWPPFAGASPPRWWKSRRPLRDGQRHRRAG